MGTGQLSQTLEAQTVDSLPQGGLQAKLDLAEREQRPLRIKLGIDPTSADIHVGHCVVLQKLREFQNAGHTAVLIIGDYTARVGDPSQRSKTRPILTEEEIQYNAQTYQDQAFQILDRDSTEIRWNGEWLGALSTAEILQLLSLSTVARILERDDFAKRYKAGTPISMLEMVYPLLQGYDSVAINADIELGGTDQLYNVLMGRDLMPHYGLAPQTVLTLPILVGTDGVQKMSKSLGNYVGVTDTPTDIFGKIMSIPDEAMPEYYRLATGLEQSAAEDYVARLAEEHPNMAKRTLARLIVERFHSTTAAEQAEAQFDQVFRSHAVPDEIPNAQLTDTLVNDAGKVMVPALLVEVFDLSSNSEARRLINGGGVRVDGNQLGPNEYELDPARVRGAIVQIGRRKFMRIT